MNGKTGFIKVAGHIVPSQRVEKISNAPADTSRAWVQLEEQKELSALSADVASAIYAAQRGLLVAN